MAIVVIDKGKQKVVNVEKVDYEKVELEKSLEDAIANNPEVLNLKELDETLKVLVLGTQFDNIDILAIDQYGRVYVIETKLFRNRDKREVVAQAVDYGACLWRDYGVDTPEARGRFWSKVDQKVRARYGIGLDEKLREFASDKGNAGAADACREGEESENGQAPESDPGDVLAELKKNVESNLREGTFRFVVAMNQLSDDIKNHIAYVNRTTKGDFLVLGVELEFYNVDEYRNLQIVVPTMFGAECRNKSGQVSTGKTPDVYDEKSFVAKLRDSGVPPNVALVGQELLAWANAEVGTVRYTRASFISDLEVAKDKYTVFLVNTSGAVQLYLKEIGLKQPFSEVGLRRELQRRLNEIRGFTVTDEQLAGNPGPRLEVLADPQAMKAFKDAILWAKEQILHYHSASSRTSSQPQL